MLLEQHCVITGWGPMNSVSDFRWYISRTPAGKDLWDPEVEINLEEYGEWYEQEAAKIRRRMPSEGVRDGLLYTDEEFLATGEYVVVAPCLVEPDGEVVVPELELGAELEVLNENTITYVYDVWAAGHAADNGVYTWLKAEKTQDLIIKEERILINFCAFLILQHLIPGLKAHVLYEFVLVVDGRCGFPDVDYGPVLRARGADFRRWGRVADFAIDYYSDFEELDDGEDLEAQLQWLQLLTQEGKSDKEILEDAWMGVGNMWVFSHPGIFPIADAAKLAEERLRTQGSTIDESCRSHFEVLATNPLLTLPTELMEIILCYLPPKSMLSLICTSRTTYGRFHPRLDELAYIWIREERPWYLPVGPIGCKEGDTEIVHWRDDWRKEANIGGEESEGSGEIPWLVYHFACKRSPNIRSRERIWKIVLQIKELLALHSVSTLPTVI